MRAFIAVAVSPTPEIEKLLKELKRYDCVKTVGKQNLHANISFLGEIDDETASRIIESLKRYEGSGCFNVKLSGIGAFPTPNFLRVIWIGMESPELQELAGKIQTDLERTGFNKEKDYIPHVTLARVKKKPPEELKKYIGPGEFGEQKIEQVHLYKSVLKKPDPEYAKIFTVNL